MIIMMNGNAIDKKLTCLSMHTCMHIYMYNTNTVEFRYKAAEFADKKEMFK